MDHELPSPASRTLVCEAEEIESFGFGPHPDRSRQGLMPKRHEPRLFRVEGQSKPFESLGKHLQYPLGIVLRPARALLARLPLGPRPWLRQLRGGLLRVVLRLLSCRVGGGGAFTLPPSARSNGSCSFPASRFPVWTPRGRQEHSDAGHQADQTYESHFRHQPSGRILAVSDIPPSLGYE